MQRLMELKGSKTQGKAVLGDLRVVKYIVDDEVEDLIVLQRWLDVVMFEHRLHQV